MTPREAIKIECRFCKCGSRFECESIACNLNKRGLSPLKRIRRHCLNCVETSNEISLCSGKVLNPEPQQCPLWEYRFGTNPALKGRGNLHNLKPFPKKAVSTSDDSDFLP